MKNQIFGYQVSPDDIPSNNIVFEGTNPVKIATPIDGRASQVRLFAYPQTRLRTYVCRETGACAYVWGIPAHPEVGASDIPAWCANVVSLKRYERFKELVGPFVVIMDEPRQHRITFVTDFMGVRPMFCGMRQGRLVFGSEVWPIHKTGLVGDTVDYDSVGSWIAYGYNCTDGSFFSDLRRLPPGSAVVFQDGRYTEVPYATFNGQDQSSTAVQAAEDIHHMVSSAVKTLLADHPRVSLALSGGFDSRYLLALSLSLSKASITCASIPYAPEEEQIAGQVAATLGVPLRTYSISGSTWDLYDQSFHFSADGFPISKFVTYCIAKEYPDLPMVNGFMGDPLVRGSRDKFEGKYETEFNGNLADALQRKHLMFGLENMDRWFRKGIAERIRMRSRTPMEHAVKKGSAAGKLFAWADFYYRQRHYISNNFLQHIGLTEALLPFYNWPLLSYKMEHDYRAFSRDVYDTIFQRYFPALAKVPHAADLPRGKVRRRRIANCARRWAKEILPLMCGNNRLSLLSRTRSVPRVIAGIAGVRRAERVLFFLERLYLLEKGARDAGLNFDWERL